MTDQIANVAVAAHAFLASMMADPFFPNHLVEKGQGILKGFAISIEREKPADLPALYALSEAPTEAINDLAEELLDADSELETMARDAIGEDFEFVAKAYGFEGVDAEELIAVRDW